jgi:hypothetical protein
MEQLPPLPPVMEMENLYICMDMRAHAGTQFLSPEQPCSDFTSMETTDSDSTAIFWSIFSSLSLARVGPSVDGASSQNQCEIEFLKLRIYRFWSAITQHSKAYDLVIDKLNGNKFASDGLLLVEHTLKTQEKAMATVENGGANENRLLKFLQNRSLENHELHAPCPADGQMWIIGDKKDFDCLQAKIISVLDTLETPDFNEYLNPLRKKDATEIKNEVQASGMDFHCLILKVDANLSPFLGYYTSGSHWYIDNQAKDDAQLYQGNFTASDYSGPTTHGNNKYLGTIASGNAKVIQGNMFGRTPFS